MNEVLNHILRQAHLKGLNQAEVAKKAGIHPVSLSRALTSGRCQLTTVEALAHAVGLRLVCVEDNDLAEQMRKGSVF